MPEELLFQGEDHANRRWLVTARPGKTGNPSRPATLVSLRCLSQRGVKVLDQTGAWHPIDGWDMTRWFPASPRPVPAAVLTEVMNRLANLQGLAR